MSNGLWVAIVAACVILLALVLSACAKASSSMGVEVRKDAQGRRLLLDTPQLRADASYSYDQAIAMELRGHKLSNGMSWNDDWLMTIKSIRRHNENPEWYVRYIIEQRRKAGLPELEGVDDAMP